MHRNDIASGQKNALTNPPKSLYLPMILSGTRTLFTIPIKGEMKNDHLFPSQE